MLNCFGIIKRLGAVDTSKLEVIQYFNNNSDYFDCLIFIAAMRTILWCLLSKSYTSITKKIFTLPTLLWFPNHKFTNTAYVVVFNLLSFNRSFWLNLNFLKYNWHLWQSFIYLILIWSIGLIHFDYYNFSTLQF